MSDTPNRPDTVSTAKRFLRSFHREGVDYIFANLGTDHTPLLEAAADLRRADAADEMPTIVSCPHEFAAMSAAHGYAAETGDPQVVLVHVDVGTQNLGAAMHNAHRAGVPVYVLAGLAPVTDIGSDGSRDHEVHYFQDIFNQPGIVQEYTRWVDQYRPPADPAETVRRGLERATADKPGPVYVSATREALSTTVPLTEGREPRMNVGRGGASPSELAELREQIVAAERPLVITSDFGHPPATNRVESLVAFAETVGAGVIEHTPSTLCFPRTHNLHVGFDPTVAFDSADLVLLAETDVPWIPADREPDADTTVVQIDGEPTKPTFPRWPFEVDKTLAADAAETLAAVASDLDAADGAESRSHWREVAADRREHAKEELADHKRDGRLTPSVLSDAVASIVDNDTVLVEDAVTSRGSILNQILASEPGSYLWKGGAGLGWAPGAAVGVKLADPESRVIALVGDGAYLFANPTSCAVLATEYDAPTLTVIYDNRGWNAVEQSTYAQYPEGTASATGVPESHFETPVDLSAPARAVDAYTRAVDDPDELSEAMVEAATAVDEGRPAVLDVTVQRP